MDVLVIKGEISESTHLRIRSIFCDYAPNGDLYLILETGGGNQFFAYRIMVFLNSVYEKHKIYAVIPNYSMSAGTLMALGTDKIYMFPDSCLGPLDPQLLQPKKKDAVSTLDIRGAMATMGNQASIIMGNIIDTIAMKNSQLGDMSVSAEALASEFVAKFFQPIIEKIDPFQLSKNVRVSELNSIYGARLLQKRMKKGKDINEALQTSACLTNGYLAHDYAIVLDEAGEPTLSLSVEDIKSLSDWERISKPYYLSRENVIFEKLDSGNNKKGEQK